MIAVRGQTASATWTGRAGLAAAAFVAIAASLVLAGCADDARHGRAEAGAESSSDSGSDSKGDAKTESKGKDKKASKKSSGGSSEKKGQAAA